MWWSLVAPAGVWEQSLLGLAPAMLPDQPAETTPGFDEGVSVPESAGVLAYAGSTPTPPNAAIESAIVERRRRMDVHSEGAPRRTGNTGRFSTTSHHPGVPSP